MVNKTQARKPNRVEGDVGYLALSRGRVALIDAELMPLAMQFCWSYTESCGVGYAQASLPGGKKLKLHHLIKGSPLPGFVVDHINHDGLDNRRCNLRLVTPAQNSHNCRTPRHSSTGYKGVTARRGRYRAVLMHLGRKLHLGDYDEPWEAAYAYNEQAYALRGDFAYLNVISSPLPYGPALAVVTVSAPLEARSTELSLSAAGSVRVASTEPGDAVVGDCEERWSTTSWGKHASQGLAQEVDRQNGEHHQEARVDHEQG